MVRRSTSEFGFPPFQGAVRQIIIASVAIYVVILLLLSFAPGMGAALLEIGRLNPEHVRHGWIWQLVTYAFMAEDPWAFVVSLIGIYFLGPAVEGRIGYQRFLNLFFGTVVLSGGAGLLLSLTGVIGQGFAFSMAAAANALLMVFYLFDPNAPIMAFFVLQTPVKWLVLLFAAIETAYLLLYHFHLFYLVALLGFGAGYLWYKLFLTRRTTTGISEKYFSLRNQYYRWKRRRAARKFEVYMRDHDRTVTFDEHGNYIPPDDSGKKNGGSKSGWVN
jgi:membrane associated rhomboid family serine protease